MEFFNGKGGEIIWHFFFFFCRRIIGEKCTLGLRGVFSAVFFSSFFFWKESRDSLQMHNEELGVLFIFCNTFSLSFVFSFECICLPSLAWCLSFFALQWMDEGEGTEAILYRRTKQIVRYIKIESGPCAVIYLILFRLCWTILLHLLWELLSHIWGFGPITRFDHTFHLRHQWFISAYKVVRRYRKIS